MEPLIRLDDVHAALLTAAQGRLPAPDDSRQQAFLHGYVAALEDLKRLLDDTGVWWQRLVPQEQLGPEVARRTRAAFLERHQAFLSGPG